MVAAKRRVCDQTRAQKKGISFWNGFYFSKQKFLEEGNSRQKTAWTKVKSACWDKQQNSKLEIIVQPDCGGS